MICSFEFHIYTYNLQCFVCVWCAQSSPLGVSAAFLHHFLATHDPNMLTSALKDQVVLLETQTTRCCYVEHVDPKWVAKANVFVSHAYSYKVAGWLANYITTIVLTLTRTLLFITLILVLPLAPIPDIDPNLVP